MSLYTPNPQPQTCFSRLAAAGSEGFVVALAHTSGSLPEPPPSSALVLERRVPGLAFGMVTAWTDIASDFEVVVLKMRDR